MNEQPFLDANTVCPKPAFQQLAADTLQLAGSRRSLGSHVTRLRSAIEDLRTDRVGWKWIAEEIRRARHDDDTVGYAGTVRAAYVRAPVRENGDFDEAAFLEKLQATLKNEGGKRTLSDQVGRLSAEITAARLVGVGWRWLAQKLADAREHHGDVGTFSVQLRSLHHRLKPAPNPAPAPSSRDTGSIPSNPAPQQQPLATPPHVAAVAPPTPAIAPAQRNAGATSRIRARSEDLSF